MQDLRGTDSVQHRVTEAGREALLQFGRYDECLRLATRAVELDPYDVAAQQFVGLALFYSNRPEDAARQLERLVARRGDGRVRDLASTAGLRVGTLAGSLSWQMARDAGADAVPYEGVDEPFIDLAHGRIDAVLLDDIIVARYAARHPTLVVVADVAEGS